MIRPVAHIGAMAAYALADLTAPEGKLLISLSQNESLRGPSPAVTQAIHRAAETPHLYPDPDWTGVRRALGDVHGIDPAQIICGNGSLDLIGAIARAYLDQTTRALVPAHAYPFFRTATQMTGAQLTAVPERDLTVDVEALLTAQTSETRVVFVANPGNPTGTRIPRSDLLRLRAGLRDDVLLVIDEAYGEFADHLNEPMFDQVASGNTVVLRTMSKAYGLAGMRVGWGYFPSGIAAEVRKLLNPNNVALAGQLAAEAAVQDQTYMRDTCQMTMQIRDAFASRIRQMGLDVPDSFTNFTLIRFTTPELAQHADAWLKAEGIFLRPQSGAGLPDCLRATIGQAKDMDFTADVLSDWCQQKRISS